MIKKAIISFAAILVLLLFTAICIPYFFKDKIVEKVKTAVNENLEATVDFSDIDISLLRSFPKINLRIKDLSVTGKNDFEGVPLLTSGYFDMNVDFWAVVGGKDVVPVRSIHMEQPTLNIYVLQNGKANYDITKPDSTAKPQTETASVTLQLEKYSISGGNITYDDRSLGFFFQLLGCEHSGKGDFTTDVFDLNTTTDSKETNIAYGNATYVSKAKAHAEIIVNADMKNYKFTLKDNSIQLNDFLLRADGWTQLGETDILMDLKFSSPGSDFKSLLSVVPGSYTKDFADVKAEGKFDFKASVKGTYNDDQYPEYRLNLNVEGGKFKYPSLPMGISGINTKIDIYSPQGKDFDLMQVNVPSLAINIGNGSISGYFFLRTPVSDPDIDTRLDGKFRLDELASAFPMESVKNLNGQIYADIQAKTRMSYIDNKHYDKVNVSGTLNISDMRADATGYPPVNISNLAMKFSPDFVGIERFSGKLGKSDVEASGRIDNFLAYFTPDKTIKGNLILRSNYFDAGEWLSDEPAEKTTEAGKIAANTGKKPEADKPLFDRFDFNLDAKINSLQYKQHNLQNTVAAGHFTSYAIEFKELGTKIGNSDIMLRGKLENVFKYMSDDQTLSGNVQLNSGYLDLNQFMSTASASTAAPAQKGTPTQVPTDLEPLRIPKNLDLTIGADVKRLIYTNMDLSGLNGKVIVKNGVAKLVNTRGNTLGGQIVLNGSYDSNVEKPKFDLSYDIRSFEFQQAFNTFNTFEKLAPVGKFIQGRFNSTLTMSGDLGKDMIPDLNTINIDGFLQTMKAVVSGLKPLQEVGNQLNIKELSGFDLKDTKNWFSVKNGQVSVSPFDLKVKDIAMNISGSHALNKEMNYVIKTKVPRKLLEKNVATAAANQGINLITKEAAKYGVNVKNGEFVNCQFTLTGDILNPKVAFKLLGTDGQTIGETAKDVVNATIENAKDSIRTRVEQELEKAKEKGKEVTNKAADSIRNVATRQVDKAIEKGKEEMKGKIGEKATEILGDEAGKKAKEAIEKGRGAIDGLFKKKKKEN